MLRFFHELGVDGPDAVRSFAAATLAATLSFGALGCGDDAPPTEETGGITAGLTSDVPVASIEVSGEVNGTESESDSVDPASFPYEMALSGLKDGDDVRFTFRALDSGGEELISRIAATRAVGGETLLLPVNLDAACVAGAGAPTCGDGNTCIAGSCADPFVDPSGLSPYSSDWAGGGETDVCKAEGSSPEVIVGEGQADYLPVGDLDVLQVEAGPQGGYHVWVAVRMRGLLRSGSVTSVTGRIDELGYDLAPFNVIFTFDQDEGGFCKLYGLRFRLDDDAHPIEGLLGKQLDLTVTITDEDGDAGTGMKSILLSDDIL